MHRRAFVHRSAAVSLGVSIFPLRSFSLSATDRLLRVERITDGGHSSWFGYYDKRQVDPTGRYVLGPRVEQFFRSPTPQDVLRIGMVEVELTSEDGSDGEQMLSSKASGRRSANLRQYRAAQVRAFGSVHEAG